MNHPLRLAQALDTIADAAKRSPDVARAYSIGGTDMASAHLVILVIKDGKIGKDLHDQLVAAGHITAPKPPAPTRITCIDECLLGCRDKLQCRAIATKGNAPC